MKVLLCDMEDYEIRWKWKVWPKIGHNVSRHYVYSRVVARTCVSAASVDTRLLMDRAIYLLETVFNEFKVWNLFETQIREVKSSSVLEK